MSSPFFPGPDGNTLGVLERNQECDKVQVFFPQLCGECKHQSPLLEVLKKVPEGCKAHASGLFLPLLFSALLWL